MSDIFIQPTTNLSAPVGVNKPVYLIVLTSSTKIGSKPEYFLTKEKIEHINGFIQTKGFFVNEPLEKIIENYSAMLTNVAKELILEVSIPQHRIIIIRSLVFKAK